MEKHAVPQNIMDVEFKLFGGLTVRQFGYTAVSFILALILYFSGLTKLVTVPIIVFVVIIGLALAFVRVNDQPFSVWFSNFIKSLFGSQRRVYHKTTKTSAVLSKSPARPVVKSDADPLVKRKLGTRPALNKLNINAVEPEVVDDGVDDLLAPTKAASLDNYFNKAVGANLNKYNLKPAGNSLATSEKVPGTTQQVNAGSAATMTTQTNNQVRPLTSNATESREKVLRAPGNAQAPIAAIPPTPATVEDALDQPVQAAAALVKNDTVRLQTDQVSSAPTTEATAQETMPSQAKSDATPAEAPQAADAPVATPAVPSLKVLNQLKPNQIAGFICDASSEPIDKATIMVKNDRGEPVRSVYSDVNGKFIVPTVLDNGLYTLEVKARNYTFPEFQVELKGELLPMYRYLAS